MNNGRLKKKLIGLTNKTSFAPFHKFFRVADLPEKVDVILYNFISLLPEEQSTEEWFNEIFEFVGKHEKRDTMLKCLEQAYSELLEENKNEKARVRR